MPNKSKPTRNTFVPEQLVKQLARDVRGFKQEEISIQVALASMVWIGATKLRQHSVHNGYMSFHYRELEGAFRGRFKAVNARLKFFDVKDTYRFDGQSKDIDTFTKGYRFSPTVQACRDSFLNKRALRHSRLLDATGTGFRTPPKAVASLDMANVPTKRWRTINQAGSLSLVPVNIDYLRRLQRDLGKKLAAWVDTGHRPVDLVMEYPSFDYLVELREKTGQIIRMAHTDVAGLGRVMHRYVESDSGRLYAQNGATLQNAQVVVRQAALAGMWDYDIENCHFSIIAQMSKPAGFQCVAIEHYMSNGKAVRDEIAGAIGISEIQTKTCLLAVMYGARTTTRFENAIPQVIGADAAGRLAGLPLFANIFSDVKHARTAILASTKLNRQGGLVNAFGKSIRVQDLKPEQRLAHLTQGVEALALETCTGLNPKEIILLQHDGFTAIKQLNVAQLQEAIQRATGYSLKLKEKAVWPDLAAQFGKAAEREFSKERNNRTANGGAGFSRFSTSSKEANTAVSP